MSKDGDRGLDRAEEAFAALSSKGREGPPADPPPASPPPVPPATAASRRPGRGPWGFAALALLLLAAGLGVALFAVSSQAGTERERLKARAEGQQREAEARRAKLEATIDGMARAESRLKARLGARESFLARAENAVAILAAGHPERALASLQEIGDDDELSPVVRLLAERLDALDRAEAMPADERIEALAALETDWHFDAVSLRRARDERRREQEFVRRGLLAEAHRALAAGDPEGARTRFADAVGDEVARLADAITRAGLTAQAEAREAEGDLSGAAAFYRVLGVVAGSDAAAGAAARIEEEAARLRLASWLKRAAEERLAGGDFEASAAMLRALGEVTGVDAGAAADATRAVGLRREAERLRGAGEPEAARYLAREAARLGNPAAADLAAEISRQIEVDRERDRERREAEFRARIALDRAFEEIREAGGR